jgi:hypothetical protein
MFLIFNMLGTYRSGVSAICQICYKGKHHVRRSHILYRLSRRCEKTGIGQGDTRTCICPIVIAFLFFFLDTRTRHIHVGVCAFVTKLTLQNLYKWTHTHGYVSRPSYREKQKCYDKWTHTRVYVSSFIWTNTEIL